MSGTALTIRPEWLNPFTLSVILADLDAVSIAEAILCGFKPPARACNTTPTFAALYP